MFSSSYRLYMLLIHQLIPVDVFSVNNKLSRCGSRALINAEENNFVDVDSQIDAI